MASERVRASRDDGSLLSRDGLPAEASWLRDLFAPGSWEAHPNYGGLASFWQQIHRGIRSEALGLRDSLERYREGGRDPSAFEWNLSSSLQRYLGHLRVHHGIEDRTYFPRFRSLDPRLAAGFDLLESDHEVIHRQLEEVAGSARLLLGVLRAECGDSDRALDVHANAAERLTRLLDRHLDDEEDLVIPAILRHGDEAVSS